MKKPALLAALAALALSATLSPSVVTAAHAAVERTELRPAELHRGPNGTVPHVDGTDLVHGDLRFTFRAPQVKYLGQSGGDYLVATWRDGSARSSRVLRVSPLDARTVVLAGVPVWELTLSSDGTQLVRPRARGNGTVLKVWSAMDGSHQVSRFFTGRAVSVLDADGGRMLLGVSSPDRTFWWDTTPNTVRRVTEGVGYEADIRADRLAVVTGDPYQGGCTVVRRLSDLTRVWRSCDQAVLSFSPRGTRMATVYLLSDGLGPGEVQLRGTRGRLLARWSAHWFGDVTWESERSLLLLTHGTRWTSWVRCVATDCERAGALRNTPSM